jgi:Domain of unknown function (DUF6268)
MIRKNLILSAVGILSIFGTASCVAQPFIDLVNIQYVNSPYHGVSNEKNNITSLQNFSIQTTVPFQFKNKTDAIIISPAFEIWSPKVDGIDEDFEHQYGVALPVAYLKTLQNPDWSLLSMIIVRRNGYKLGMDNNWQVAGAMIANLKVNENLKYKFGVYASGEFFGLFIRPLLGIDWQINKKTSLYGILPGSMNLEHKLKNNLYAGASFKAITSSYRTPEGYWRLDENRLGVFLDYYLAKHIAINMEAGHSILRKMRSGQEDMPDVDWNASDNLYGKLGLAYRLRFR